MVSEKDDRPVMHSEWKEDRDYMRNALKNVNGRLDKVDAAIKDVNTTLQTHKECLNSILKAVNGKKSKKDKKSKK